MPSSVYRVFEWGDRVGGASQGREVELGGIAKKALDNEPRIVSNELICAGLARAILLPVPPGFLVMHEGDYWFVSLDFNLAGQQLPPVDPATVVAGHPELACGVVLFDIWVVNPDRHRRNLAHHEVTNQLMVFDHSRAILPMRADPAGHLLPKRGKVGISGHCLGQHIIRGTGFHHWAERILAVPEFYLRGVIDAAVGKGIDETEATDIADFLLRRRQNLLNLVNEAANGGLMPNLELELAFGPDSTTDGQQSRNGDEREEPEES